MTTIYFSGSISGGREDVETYRMIVAALEAEGHRVLAGSVIDTQIGAAGDPLDACAIFERDVRWIEEVADADGVLVAEVSRPSIGVGYEIGMARYRFDMPVIALYRPGFTKRCSGMVAGDRGIRVIEYTDATAQDMLDKLRSALSE
jgi:2'-deoxynucleoside 5'-phosphate N-hydrolase